MRSSSFGLDGGEIFFLGDGDYAVTAHDGADAGEVGMGACAIEGGDFEIVFGTQNAGCLEAEYAGRGVGGVGVGVGVGMLLAPASGEETRSTIGNKVQEFGDRVRDKFEQKREPGTASYGT